MGKRVLVCGGRSYWNVSAFRKAMSEIDADFIISGGASGADQLASEYANDMNIDQVVYPANWTKYGKSAGPIRNQLMIDDAEPDLVVAFKGGSGTADMVRRAHLAGIKVIEIND